MSSVVSKAGQGKFCLGESSQQTEGASELQASLDKGLKNATELYPAGAGGNKTVPPNTCGTPLNGTVHAEKGQNLKRIRQKLEADNVKQLLETNRDAEPAKSDPASTCPLTSIAQDTSAGIYREHTVAGMWQITSTESTTLVATYRPDKMDTIKALAKELEGVSTETENEKWKTACTIGDTNWCTEEVERSEGEDRSDTAGGKGKTRRTPQQRQRSSHCSNAKEQTKRDEKESSAERRARATDARRRGTRGKHAR
ncbi:hypothetical protein ERJ75_000697900 [Trypanosoma vivax]|nr:hypothetical protein ERJ75_000697900 [Trypanosoma vivax]